MVVYLLSRFHNSHKTAYNIATATTTAHREAWIWAIREIQFAVPWEIEVRLKTKPYLRLWTWGARLSEKLLVIHLHHLSLSRFAHIAREPLRACLYSIWLVEICPRRCCAVFCLTCVTFTFFCCCCSMSERSRREMKWWIHHAAWAVISRQKKNKFKKVNSTLFFSGETLFSRHREFELIKYAPEHEIAIWRREKCAVHGEHNGDRQSQF